MSKGALPNDLDFRIIGVSQSVTVLIPTVPALVQTHPKIAAHFHPPFTLNSGPTFVLPSGVLSFHSAQTVSLLHKPLDHYRLHKTAFT